MTALTEKFSLRLASPSIDDNISDLERVKRALAESGVEGVRVSLPVASSIPAALRESDFQVTATVAFEKTPRLVCVEKGDTSGRNLGLAIDLGTTNAVGALVDFSAGRVIAETSETNPQIAFGEDILTRIHHCLNKGGLDELQAAAVACINAIAQRLAGKAGVEARGITCASVSGNTTMAHLFLGLDPYNICRAPYVPVANRFGFMEARELGLNINPAASVYILPNVGSYVGGDVLAGILVSGMHLREEISILVDVGTNAEIVIGNRDWLLVCAGAAGPALEGGVVKHGMRAMPGTIDRIKIDPETFEPQYSVIGGEGTKPRGICGSALIDLLSELFTVGLIDGRGKFIEPPRSGRVIEHEGRKAYVVVPAPESAQGVDIIFTETDIDNLVRTKAAMYTALSVVTREIGVDFKDVADFYIAGTFGQYIAADKAVGIGMVPDIELSKYKLLGNSSLTGASEVLLSRERLDEAERVASLITYKELNVSADFMSEFRGAMFIPHTDSSLFPSFLKN